MPSVCKVAGKLILKSTIHLLVPTFAEDLNLCNEMSSKAECGHLHAGRQKQVSRG